MIVKKMAASVYLILQEEHKIVVVKCVTVVENCVNVLVRDVYFHNVLFRTWRSYATFREIELKKVAQLRNILVA